jgi:hypothetical protein
MKKPLAVFLASALLVPALGLAADAYEEKDFKWDDPFLNLYRQVIVAGVNKVAREVPNCATLDPASVQYEGGTPDDPGFVVTCGEAGHISHAHFTKAEITGDPASNVPQEERAGH